MTRLIRGRRLVLPEVKSNDIRHLVGVNRKCFDDSSWASSPASNPSGSGPKLERKRATRTRRAGTAKFPWVLKFHLCSIRQGSRCWHSFIWQEMLRHAWLCSILGRFCQGEAGVKRKCKRAIVRCFALTFFCCNCPGVRSRQKSKLGSCFNYRSDIVQDLSEKAANRTSV